MIPFLNKTVLVFLLVIGMQAAVVAAAIPNISIINAGLGKHFGLKIEGLDNQRAAFTVATPEGQPLFTQAVAGESYQSIFSMETFGEGSYLFILKLDDMEIRQPVRVTKRAILHDVAEREVVTFPAVSQADRQIDIAFNNAGAKACILAITNEQGETVFREVIKGKSAIHKRLALADLPAGAYQLSVTTPMLDWSKAITLH